MTTPTLSPREAASVRASVSSISPLGERVTSIRWSKIDWDRRKAPATIRLEGSSPFLGFSTILLNRPEDSSTTPNSQGLSTGVTATT